MSRGIAFLLDALLVNLAALFVAIGTVEMMSVVHTPSDVRHTIAATGGALYALWGTVYFVGFWSTTGQTPGDRVMGFRVATARDTPPAVGWALLRWLGLILAALPLFAGYLPILVDDRRRGLHDRLARTFVVEAPVTETVTRH